MIARERAQSVFLVPTHAQMLRDLGDDVIARADLSSLDTLYFNAAALPVTLKEWVLDAFPHVGVHELYGSTEGGIITNLRPADARRKAGSVGHAWHFTQVRVVDDAGDPVAPGEPGELFSRSPYLMNGYLHDPAATAACTTEDGFLTCGDVVTQDEDGYLRIVDRKKDLIISGGVNVYPRDVEEAVLDPPRRRARSRSSGSPDETWGEQVVAYVVTAPGATHRPAHARRPPAPGAVGVQDPAAGRRGRRAAAQLGGQGAQARPARELRHARLAAGPCLHVPGLTALAESRSVQWNVSDERQCRRRHEGGSRCDPTSR